MITRYYRIDSEGLYIGCVEIDPKLPLPGRGIVGIEPPAFNAPEIPKWIGNAWQILPEKPAAPEPSVDFVKSTIKQKVTSLRWERETGGITLPGGVRVGTSIEDQNRITSVITNAQLAGVSTVDFKAATGWVELTLAEVQGIAAAIAVHVQMCFSAERKHHEAIDAIMDIATLQDYDTSAYWPLA